MENATPIFQLQNGANNQSGTDSRKDPVEMVSYSDVLKNMSNDTQRPPSTAMMSEPPMMQQQEQQHIPYPYQQQQHPQQQQYMYGQQAEPSHQEPPTLIGAPQTTDFQNEMIVLLIVYVIVHTPHVQNLIKTKMPGVVNDATGATGIMGTLVNGALLILLWTVSKRFVLRYMKDL